NRIESTLQNQRIIFFVLIIVLLGIFLFFGYRIYKEKQNYKKRFEAILAQQSTEDATTAPRLLNEIQIKSPQKFNYEFYNKIPGLNPIFVESILKQLENFEKEEKFLDSQVSQKALSEDFSTNSTYFSKIINTYKWKNFTLYINDLRLDYIIDPLKNDVKYLNMDVKELASLAGFSSTENFSDHFRRKFDLKPSVFIKMMKEKL